MKQRDSQKKWKGVKVWRRMQAESFGTKQESQQTKGIETGVLQGHWDGMKQTQDQSCCPAPASQEVEIPGKG